VYYAGSAAAAACTQQDRVAAQSIWYVADWQLTNLQPGQMPDNANGLSVLWLLHLQIELVILAPAPAEVLLAAVSSTLLLRRKHVKFSQFPVAWWQLASGKLHCEDR
jgi:hypothetical protein